MQPTEMRGGFPEFLEAPNARVGGADVLTGGDLERIADCVGAMAGVGFCTKPLGHPVISVEVTSNARHSNPGNRLHT